MEKPRRIINARGELTRVRVSSLETTFRKELNMTTKIAKKSAFISFYPTEKWRIVTFTSDLIANIKLASEGEFDTIICAMDWGDNPVYSESIKLKIHKDVKYDYIHPAKQSQLRNELN